MSYSFWWRLFGLLALEATVLIVMAVMVARRTNRAGWQRTTWQTTCVAMLLLFLCEATGLSGVVASLVALKPKRQDSPFVIVQPLSAAPTLKDSSANLKATRIDPSQVPRYNPPATAIRTWWPALVCLLGMAVIVVQKSAARITFLFLWKMRQPVKDQDLQMRVDGLARRLGIRRRIRLTETRPLRGPIAFGIFRPSICLPLGFSQHFTTTQQEAMLAHELAHLCAHDPAWYCLADLVAAFWWWHPLVWWLRRKLQYASEHAADEACLLVENGPGALAECLLEIARHFVRPHSFSWLGIEGNGFRSSLARRINRLFGLSGHWQRVSARFRIVAFLAAGIALLTVLVVAADCSSEWNLDRRDLSHALANLRLERPRSATAAPKAQIKSSSVLVNGVPVAPVPNSKATTEEKTAADTPALYTRSFKLDPNTFVQGLERFLAKQFGPSNRNRAVSVGDVVKKLKALFLIAGADLSAPKAIFFNEGSGLLLVRGTLEDLDAVERTIAALNDSPPQLKIEFKLVELSDQNLLAFLRIDHAAAYDLSASEDGMAQRTIQDPPRKNGWPLSPNDETLLQWVLTRSQHDVILKALAQRNGVRIISLPTITTLSGRQTEVRAADAPAADKGTANDADLPLPIDIVPSVQADHYTIRMMITPTIKELLGYDLDAGTPIDAVGGLPPVGKIEALRQLPSTPVPSGATTPAAAPSTGAVMARKTVIPIFRIRNVATSAVLWDGQTVVLGTAAVVAGGKPGNQPILGDLPLVGRLFRIDQPDPEKRRFLIFITPRIIDPAGNLVHTPGALPFSETSVPPQRLPK